METTVAYFLADIQTQPTPVFNQWFTGAWVLFLITISVGIPTNTLLIVAYIKHPSLQSPTNLLIVFQGFADLLSCIVAPLYSFMNFTNRGMVLGSTNKYLCLSGLCAIILTVWSSLLNLLTITIDRLLVIHNPYLYSRIVTESLVTKIIIIMWVFFVVILSLPFFGLNTWTGGKQCSASNVLLPEYFVNFFLLSSLLVLILVAAMNLVICGIVVSKRRVMPANSETHKQQKSQYKLTKMLLIVVGLFYACWLPYTVTTMVNILARETLFASGFPGWWRVLVEYAKVPVVVNLAVNPLIYAWKSSKYRRAFKKTLGMRVDEAMDADNTAPISVHHAD